MSDAQNAGAGQDASHVTRRPWRALRLTPRAQNGEAAAVEAVLRRRDASVVSVRLPVHPAVSYVIPPQGPQEIASLSSAQAEIVELGPIASLLALARSRLSRKMKYRLVHAGLVFDMRGPTRARRHLAGASRFLAENGLRLDSPQVSAHPELFDGFHRLAPVPSPAAAAPLKMAIALHLHYQEIWPDLAAALRALPYACDLFVTWSGPDADIEPVLRADFPNMRFRRVENRGRDIRPFLTLLEEGAFDGYDLVCKIHGKRSVNAPAVVGALWRRKIILDLLAGAGALPRIAEAFAANPRLGLVGPRGFRKFRNPVAPDAWRAPSQSPDHILATLGGDPRRFAADFFAGAMFWARPAALAALKPHKFSAQFAPETGGIYDGLEVAFETAFCAIVRLAGYEIGDVDAFDGPGGASAIHPRFSRQA
ncbi:hypothetical protein M2323_002130 [Rhodoblastus acidophilus]|uniref:rhamnan synthesis F family protein n=1 Tax=Rhodoblastus acidophilus TaxID=1074 RepID=UPI002225608F|nr:rhamnan synthesis F family protein [Rhodoblastus acidophilus]MCW2284321.1 hypothetical protein [Rhodoblastus acidophilus]MCW2333201.1 hypothetical protein [Rhodoblastus acidophilus]